MSLETVSIFLVTTGRILVGVVMFVAGIAKLKVDAEQFRNAILGYGLVSPVVATFLGKVLPWVEVVTGICLIVGLFSAIASLIAFALLLVFSAAMTMSLYRGRKHDCGCFGQAKGQQVQWRMVYRNLALMGVLVAVSVLSGRVLAEDSSTLSSAVSPNSPLVLTSLGVVWVLCICGASVLHVLTHRKSEHSQIA